MAAASWDRAGEADRRRRCGWPSRSQGWRLRRGSGRLAPSLRRRRRSLRRALNGRGCGPGLPWRCRLRRRSRRRGGRPGRRRRAGALDRGELRGRGGGTAFAGGAPGFPAPARRRRRRGSGGGAGSCDPYLSSISAIAASSALLLARDVAFRQRRTQASELFEQRVPSAAIDRRTRRRRTRVGQIGDGSHEQRMIISHEASAQPLRVMPQRVP